MLNAQQSSDPDIHQMISWLEMNTCPDKCPRGVSWKLSSLWLQRRYHALRDGILHCVFVNEFMCGFGVPDSVHTDQGKIFQAKILKEICTLLDIKKTRTTAYRPQSDGLVESFNRTLLGMLSMVVREDEQGWDLLLPSMLLAHRTSHHATTRSTPIELMFGHDPHLPEDDLFSIPGAVKQYAEVLKNRMQQAHARVLQYMAMTEGVL